MYCKKCGKDVAAVLKKDSRGVVDAYCPECETHLKKMSSAEIMDLLYEAVKHIDELEKPSVSADLGPSMPCKYCGERFFYQFGRMGNIYLPLDDAKFCPMCGRELTGKERDY